MKKLLVILMLSAGFVTVASAHTPLDCTNNTTNQCCIDVASIKYAISQSPTNTILTATGDDKIWSIAEVLTNTANDNCLDTAVYQWMGNDSKTGFAVWFPGGWENSLTIYNQ